MKMTVSPRTVVFLVLGLLSPLVLANPESQSKQNRNVSADVRLGAESGAFHLPPPATTGKPSTRTSGPAEHERGVLRTRSIQRKVNAKGMTPYEIEPDSLAKGLAAVSAAYRREAAR